MYSVYDRATTQKTYSESKVDVRFWCAKLYGGCQITKHVDDVPVERKTLKEGERERER